MRARNPRYAGNLANVITALTIRPELVGCVAFDEMANAVELRRALPGSPGGNWPVPHAWADHDTLMLQDFLQAQCQMARVGKEAVTDGALHAARLNAFHPVRNFLDALVWDGTPRLDTWLADYLGVAPSPYATATGRMFLISMVARVRRPGCKSDHLLVLEGPQGIYKSQACAVLGGRWFSDQSLDIRGDARAASQHLRGKWLVEISELTAFRQAEVENLKAFIARTHERYLPRYARHEVEEPRTCVLIGTTNNADYLRDSTGARRFWPHYTERIDIHALVRDRDQLLVEADRAYRAGEHWYPAADLDAAIITPEQNARYDLDAWAELIGAELDRLSVTAAKIGQKARTTLLRVWQAAMTDPITSVTPDATRFDRGAQLRVREILQFSGWKRGARTAHARWWEAPL